MITPDGRRPTPTRTACPASTIQEDKDYLASVVRTFARDVDDIRITCTRTPAGLAAAVASPRGWRAGGRSAAEAHRIVGRGREAGLAAGPAARGRARRGQLTRADRGQIQEEVNAQRADSEHLAAGRLAALQAIPGFQQPVALSGLSEADLAEFDAVFTPGGHGPMVDLSDNPDVARLLTVLHGKGAPIAALCHGPALLPPHRSAPTGSGCSTDTG